MVAYRECFYCHKTIAFDESCFNNQKEQSTQFFCKKCYKKYKMIAIKEGRMDEDREDKRKPVKLLIEVKTTP